MKSTKKIYETRGRPRAFDTDEALERALQVFWRKGYEGTSLTDLTEAMGINRPSLYAAFGNKEAIFRKALDRYESGPAAYIEAAMQLPTARAAVEQILAGVVNSVNHPTNPTGCLLVQGALACSESTDPIRQALIAHRRAGEARLRERFERAVSEGELPSNTNSADLARYFTTIIHGMGVQAASGASREELQGVAQLAMQSWPMSCN